MTKDEYDLLEHLVSRIGSAIGFLRNDKAIDAAFEFGKIYGILIKKIEDHEKECEKKDSE